MKDHIAYSLQQRHPAARFRVVEMEYPEDGTRSLGVLWTGQATYSAVARTIQEAGRFVQASDFDGKGLLLKDAGRLVVNRWGRIEAVPATPYATVQIIYHRRLGDPLPPPRRGWRVRKDDFVLPPDPEEPAPADYMSLFGTPRL